MAQVLSSLNLFLLLQGKLTILFLPLNTVFLFDIPSPILHYLE